MNKTKRANVLVLDIETKPILAWVWDIWEQNIPLNMIEEDWSILCWSAKWLRASDGKVIYGPHDKVMYDSVETKTEKQVLAGIHKLMNQADIIIGQNSKQFDIKKLNARFLKYGFTPVSPYKQHDTKQMMSKYFALTSKKLEYASDELNVKYKKLKHSKFPGFSLWKECMAGNKLAWKEMIKYNVHDVLSCEELFNILAPWDTTVRFDVYNETILPTCNCGSIKFSKGGTRTQITGVFQRYTCKNCGAWYKQKISGLDKEKKDNLLK